MQTRQYGCITWSLGVECGGTEHETSGLFGNIADEREAINPLSVWLDTGYNKTCISQNLVKLQTNLQGVPYYWAHFVFVIFSGS